jgi:small subunit ribosomal protein S16
MSVKIRLRRMGNRNRPFYRVVVADSRRSRDGRIIESLGWYDPMAPGKGSQKIDLSRVDYWTGVGAIMNESVRSLVKRARKSATTEA